MGVPTTLIRFAEKKDCFAKNGKHGLPRVYRAAECPLHFVKRGLIPQLDSHQSH